MAATEEKVRSAKGSAAASPCTTPAPMPLFSARRAAAVESYSRLVTRGTHLRNSGLAAPTPPPISKRCGPRSEPPNNQGSNRARVIQRQKAVEQYQFSSAFIG